MSKIIDNSQLFSQANVTTSFDFVYDVSAVDNIAFSITLTPVSSGTGTLVLNASVDGTNYAPIAGTSASISTSQTIIYTVLSPAYKFVQIEYTADTDGMDLLGSVCARSETIVSN